MIPLGKGMPSLFSCPDAFGYAAIDAHVGTATSCSTLFFADPGHVWQNALPQCIQTNMCVNNISAVMTQVVVCSVLEEAALGTHAQDMQRATTEE